MPSENPSISASTVQSKVRLLLGLPPQPTLTYPSPLPAVGFRYAAEPLMGVALQPDTFTPPDVSTAPEDEAAYRRPEGPAALSALEAVKDVQVSKARSLPTSRHMPPRFEPADGAEHAEERVTNQPATAPAVEDVRRAEDTSNRVESSNTTTERVNLNVPGISKEDLNFPALSSVGSEAEAAEIIAEQRSKQEGTPSKVWPALQQASSPKKTIVRDVKDMLRAEETIGRVEPPGITTEQIDLDVPGTSKEVVNFPALSHIGSEAEDAATTIEQRPKQEETLKAQSALHRTSAPKEKVHQIASEPVKALSSPAGKPQADEGRSVALTRNPPPDVPRRFMVGAARSEAGAKRAPPASSSHPSSRSSATLSGDQSYPHVQPHRLVSDSGAAAATLEQLRHAVRQVTAKVAAQSAQAQQDKSRESEPSPPIQHVVVVNKVARAPGGSHAFWERRHLGRSRFRVMR